MDFIKVCNFKKILSFINIREFNFFYDFKKCFVDFFGENTKQKSRKKKGKKKREIEN